MNETGLNALRWVQENRTPDMEAFFMRVTEAGDGVWLMAALGVLFWLFGARIAYRAGLALLLGDVAASLVKNLVCLPRPWLRDPLIEPVAAAKWGAFGYSFPSGHAASTALLWGGTAVAARRGWLWIPALAWIALMGASRVVLGVHTPVDVAGSWAVAIPVVWAAAWAVGRVEDNPSRGWQVLGIAALAGIAAALIVRWRPLPEGADPMRFGRDTWRAAAALLAFLAAWHVERTHIRYEPAQLGGYRILAVAAGVLVIVLMAGHLRRLTAPWLGENGAIAALAVAYPVWIFVVWPVLLKGLEKPEPR